MTYSSRGCCACDTFINSAYSRVLIHGIETTPIYNIVSSNTSYATSICSTFDVHYVEGFSEMKFINSPDMRSPNLLLLGPIGQHVYVILQIRSVYLRPVV